MTDPHHTTTQLMVLHTLRCIGFSIESRVATATGLTLETTTGDLENLKLHGLVIDTPGPFGGWALTDEGTARRPETDT